jgi:hypothetical protein
MPFDDKTSFFGAFTTKAAKKRAYYLRPVCLSCNNQKGNEWI